MLKILLIILFFIVLINKPTYVWRRVVEEKRIYAARIPLWLAIIGLCVCEPETFLIVSRQAYNILWEQMQEEETN